MLIVILLIYLFIFGQLATLLLRRFFGFTKNFSTLVLGMFLVGVTASWLGGLALIFFTWQPVTFASVLVLNGLLYVPALRYKKSSYSQDSSVAQPDNAMRVDVWTVLGVVVFFACLVYGFILLSQSRSGDAILTPWQTISPLYIYVFFIATFTLGLLIFSSLKTKTLLLFLILQTFLLHSYLPMSHKFIYGADGWRHIANEQRFLEGKKFLQPQLAGVSEHGSSIMENFQSKIGQLSYGNFWAANIMLAQIFKTDLITITKWFLPVLWSLVFPLLLFELGLLFGWGDKKSLFFSWLGLWPFAWHAAGSFSLPVNFGFLIWLFFLLLLLKRLTIPKSGQMLLLVIAGLSFAFGYSLFFVLFGLAFLTGEFLLVPFRLSQRIKKIIAACVVAFAIPGLELLAGYSQATIQVGWLGQIKQLIGNLLGVYFASGPRPHDISTGNIILNQTPAAAFVFNIFVDWRWWLVGFMLCFFGFVIYGQIKAWHQDRLAVQWMSVFSTGIFIGYIISNYFLSGSHILARRLDGVVALILISLFSYGIFECWKKIQLLFLKNGAKHPQLKLTFVIIAVMLLAAFTTASYSIGPDTETVSAQEYDAMQEIWIQSALYEPRHFCVLANTYPLLALEAISSKEVIGGNFPIDANFGQSELIKLYGLMQNNDALTDLQDVSLLKSFTDGCWYVEAGQVNAVEKINYFNKFYPQMKTFFLKSK
jgi:hypothetical protein